MNGPERKSVQDEFRAKLGLVIDVVKQGKGQGNFVRWIYGVKIL